MKVRITGNSIRFRLKQKEVKQFGEQGEIKEELSFGTLPADKLSFILKAGNTDRFTISWESNQVMLQVPAGLRADWTNTDLVGFENDILTAQGQLLRILVEKDFKCLDGIDVDDEDAYPNPNQDC